MRMQVMNTEVTPLQTFSVLICFKATRKTAQGNGLEIEKSCILFWVVVTQSCVTVETQSEHLRSVHFVV